MDQVLALRPFVPATDLARSVSFYEALGFRATHRDDGIAMLKLGGFSFILQHRPEAAAYAAQECMVQLLVRDVDAWWRGLDAGRLVSEFGVKPPRPPAMQSWGMKVGFLFDPSGVLWHVAEAPF